MRISLNPHADLVAQVEQDLQAALEQLVELAGRDVNFNSPKQVLALLGDLGLEVSSTAEAALAPFATDQAVVGALLKYRKLKKLQGLYGPTFASHVNRVTERIHADYRQLGSVASRMSCTHPNAQQVPHEANYRSLFVAPPGRKLLKADYSQIELRIGAEISDDKAL